eukprot:SAG31_NODE_7311_length_1723_cov_2.195197_2_plen_105_part_00
MGGLILPDDKYCCPSIQARFQLDDCDSSTHTMSTVPESVEAKRALRIEPRLDKDGSPAPHYAQVSGQFIVDSWRNMAPGVGPMSEYPHVVDLHVSAGDVIILNN